MFSNLISNMTNESPSKSESIKNRKICSKLKSSATFMRTRLKQRDWSKWQTRSIWVESLPKTLEAQILNECPLRMFWNTCRRLSRTLQMSKLNIFVWLCSLCLRSQFNYFLLDELHRGFGGFSKGVSKLCCRQQSR